MKGSHVAALVIGWLAVAFGSAVIGSASIARVGLGAAQPQSQITVSRSAAPTRALPTGEGVADFVGPDAAPTIPPALTATPDPKPATRVVWSAPGLTAIPVTTVPTDATAPATDQPLLPPSSVSGGEPTLGLAPTASATPSSSSPGKSPTKKGNNAKSTPTPAPSVLLAQ